MYTEREKVLAQQLYHAGMRRTFVIGDWFLHGEDDETLYYCPDASMDMAAFVWLPSWEQGWTWLRKALSRPTGQWHFVSWSCSHKHIRISVTSGRIRVEGSGETPVESMYATMLEVMRSLPRSEGGFQLFDQFLVIETVKEIEWGVEISSAGGLSFGVTKEECSLWKRLEEGVRICVVTNKFTHGKLLQVYATITGPLGEEIRHPFEREYVLVADRLPKEEVVENA